MSDPDTSASAATERSIVIADRDTAQAVFGPLHRHIALIHDAFRDPNAPRGTPAYTLDIHVHGSDVTLKGAAADVERAEKIFDALLKHHQHKRRLREGEVLAAIAFSERGGEAPLQLELPQFGGLTLRTPRQLAYVRALQDDRLDLIFGVGPAGTGKTYLAVAAAVDALRRGAVDRIVVTRPAVEAGERLGFLPGALEEKVDPYLQPIWDAFRSQKVSDNDLKDRRKIEVAPIGFMRGRTLASAFVIIDEAQNATIPQMKMVLTRLGEGSKMVVTGDPTQVDLPRASESGLAHALSILSDVDGVETIRFGASDVVRHRLVARIIESYEAAERRARGESYDG